MAPPLLPEHALYHYTTAAGLHGILSKEVIRATSIEFMNDSAELRLTTEIFQKLLKKRAKVEKGRVAQHLERLADWLQPSLIRTGDEDGPPTVFAFCLSKKPDQLSQWRSYCAGGGYSLQFDREALARAAHEYGFRLEKCLYVDPNKEDSPDVDLLFQSAIDGIVSFENVSMGPRRRSVIWYEFLTKAPLIKHIGFSEEEEWRLVSSRGTLSRAREDICFSQKANVLVPYVEVRVPKDDGAITRVMIGPHPHQTVAEAGVQYLQRCTGWDVTIECSRIPYRELR